MARYDYLPFEEEIQSGTGLRTTAQGYGAADERKQKYALLERDEETGQDHAWWRKYESMAGRWTTPDPYTGSMSIGDPQSLNRYSYVGNDPVNRVDPSGLEETVPRPDFSMFWDFIGYVNAGPGFIPGGGEGEPRGKKKQKKRSGFKNPSKEECAEKAREIERLAENAERRAEELRRDSHDFVPGGDERQIRTHVKSFEAAQKPLKEAIDYYDKHCKGKGPPNAVSDRARQLAGQPAPTRTRAPNAPIPRSLPESSIPPWVVPVGIIILTCILCPECCAIAAPVFAVP